MPKSVVAIVKGAGASDTPGCGGLGQDAGLMIEEALKHLGGVNSLITPGSTVIVKPNAGHAAGPESAVCTSPEVVAAVIRIMRKANPKKIILAEAAAIGMDTMACLAKSGIMKAAQDAGVDEIRDIKADKDLVNVKIRNPMSAIKNVMLPRFLLAPDALLINVPIFKSHTCMVFSNALKNLKGVVQDCHHYVMHCTNLAGAMMDLGAIVQARLTITDMIRPMEGFGPHSGTPVDFGCIVAGQDMVAVDATCCRLAGLPLEQVEYFEAARNRGLGNFEEDQIEVRGTSIREAHKPLYLPYLGGFENWPEYHFHIRNACSSCQGLLSFTMSRLKALGQYEKNRGMHIIVGNQAKLPEGVTLADDLVLLGDCSRGLKKKIEEAGGKCLLVAGCPPTEPAPSWVIMDREEQPEEITAEMGAMARRRATEESIIFEKWLREQKGRSD